MSASVVSSYFGDVRRVRRGHAGMGERSLCSSRSTSTQRLRRWVISLSLSLSLPSTSYRISLQRGRRDIRGGRLTSSTGNAHHFGAYGIRYDAVHRQFHIVISSVEADLCGEPMHNASSKVGWKFRVEGQTLYPSLQNRVKN